MYAKILQKLLQNFFLTMGRAPITPNEWSKLRKQAMELAAESGNDPITGTKIQSTPKSLMDTTKDLPTKDVLTNRPNILPFPKQKSRNMTPLKRAMNTEGIRGLMMKGNVRLGEAPKTLKSTLDSKKAAYQGHINKEMWVKDKMQQNKNAIQRFKEKFLKNEPKTVEDFTKKGDWDPSGMAEGGIAPLVGEPSYAADFYDDRTPMKKGKKVKKWFTYKPKEWPPSLRTGDLRKWAREKREDAEFEGIWRGAPPSMKDREKMYRKERTFNKMEKERKEAFDKKIDEREKLYPYADMTEEEFSVAYPDVYDFMKKDPAFDFETFKKVSFSNIGETFQAQGARDYRGDGLPLGRTNTRDLELFMTPFGDEAQEMTTEGPIYGQKRQMSDIDKAAVVLHELRHKKILQDDELVAAQPPLAVEDIEWRHKGPERWGVPTADDRGEHEPKPPPHYKHLNPKGSKEKYSHPLSMHELFVRYLDDQYGHTDTPSGPYFDKIWRDEWKPYAEKYEQILKQKKDPEEGLGITAAAQGGRIPYAGGSIVKGGRWFLNNLRKALKDIEADKGFKNLTPERKEGLTSEIKNLIKSVEGGGPIPDEMIQTIRHDPKFAEISKTRSTDPDLYEFEDLILNYGKKGDVVDEQVQILEKFDPTDRLPNNLGGRVSYSGGGLAGLPPVTSGMSMQGPQMPAGPQPAGISGANMQMNQINLNQDRNQMMQTPYMPTGGQPYGGQLRFPFAGGGMGRRAFMKLMAGLGALPFIGKGVSGVSKVAPKVLKEAEVITRGPDGMPSYVLDLIEVVKAKGTKDIIEGFKKSDYSTVHSYKGVDVIEDGAGNIKIKSDRGGVATDAKTGKTHEGIAEEHHMQIDRGETIIKDEGLETQKAIQAPDEYIEGTVRPDMDGKMKDFEDGLDDDVHDYFKKIADEVGDVYYDDVNITGQLKRPKKASGGLAYALGE